MDNAKLTGDNGPAASESRAMITANATSLKDFLEANLTEWKKQTRALGESFTRSQPVIEKFMRRRFRALEELKKKNPMPAEEVAAVSSDLESLDKQLQSFDAVNRIQELTDMIQKECVNGVASVDQLLHIYKNKCDADARQKLKDNMTKKEKDPAQDGCPKT